MRANRLGSASLPASDASSVVHRDYLSGRNTIVDLSYNTRRRASTVPSRRSSTTLASMRPKSAIEGGIKMARPLEDTQQLLDNEQTWQELEEARKATLRAALAAVRQGPLSNNVKAEIEAVRRRASAKSRNDYLKGIRWHLIDGEHVRDLERPLSKVNQEPYTLPLHEVQQIANLMEAERAHGALQDEARGEDGGHSSDDDSDYTDAERETSPREGSYRHRGTIEIRRQSINQRLPFSSLHEGTADAASIKLRHTQRLSVTIGGPLPDETFTLPTLYATSTISLAESHWPSASAADLEPPPQKPLRSPAHSHPHHRLKDGQAEAHQPHHKQHKSHSRTPSHPSPQAGGLVSPPSQRADSSHGRRSSQDMTEELQYHRHQRRASAGLGSWSPEGKQHILRSPHNGGTSSPNTLLLRHHLKQSHVAETLEPSLCQLNVDLEQEQQEEEEKEEQEQKEGHRGGVSESTPTSRKGPEVLQLLDLTGDLERLSDGGEEDEIYDDNSVWRKQTMDDYLEWVHAQRAAARRNRRRGFGRQNSGKGKGRGKEEARWMRLYEDSKVRAERLNRLRAEEMAMRERPGPSNRMVVSNFRSG